MKIIDKKGLTLIELLVVISLLAILAGIMLSIIRPAHFQDTSRDSVRITNVKKIAEAAELYYQLENSFAPDQSTLYDSQYITNWPTDSPMPGDTYVYQYISTSNSFIVYTANSLGGTYVYRSTNGVVQQCDSSRNNCTALE